jgi:hypothetical protein
MKKLILSAAVIALAGFSTVNAYTPKSALAYEYNINKIDDRTPVKLEELPDAIKKVLASDDFKEWIPSEAFLVKTDKGSEYYEINVKKGEQTGSLKIDKDGNAVREEAAPATTVPQTEPQTQPAPDTQTQPAPETTDPQTTPETQPVPETTDPQTAPEQTQPAPQQDNTETAPQK